MTEKANWFDYVPAIIAIPVAVVILTFAHLLLPPAWVKRWGLLD